MTIKVKKTDNKWFLTPVKRAVAEYGMIQEGDRIAVGLSGGKDSSTLFYIMTILQQQLPFHFELVPICLTLGFENMDISPLAEYVEKLGSKLYVKSTLIGKVIFDVRQEKNPCSLCANMRRGALYDAAKSLGCNKAALGHHLDDAFETFMMNLIFNGRMGTFQPRTYLDRRDITVIRPMLYLEERSIQNIVKTKGIPVIKNTCPVNKKTKREEMKNLISQLSINYPDIRYKFLNAVKNVELTNFWNTDL